MADINSTTWSETAALNNTGTFPSFPENMPPSNVNDSAREMMGGLKREWNRSHPTATSTGSANALALTYTVGPTAYVAGDTYSFVSGFTNTGPTTLAVNGLTATSIFLNGAALTGGEILNAAVITVAYDGTRFQILYRSIATVPSSPNLLVNPFMEIDQANEGAAVSLLGSKYIVDGWQVAITSASAVGNSQRVADGPINLPNSVKTTISTGASVGVGDALIFFQPIEASSISGTGFGTATAKSPLSLSFWVKSSIGSYTMCGAVRNTIPNRSYPFNFTITNANTWEQKFITIPVDSTGTWVTSGTGVGLTLIITAACGANLQSTVNTWVTGNFFGTSSITNTLLSTNGASFNVSAAKLEVSSVPTPLTRLHLADELVRCQRYYEKSYDIGVAVGTVSNAGISWFENQTSAVGGSGPDGRSEAFKVTKRIVPSMTLFSPGTGASGKARDFNGSADLTGTVGTIGQQGYFWTAIINTVLSLGVHWTADSRL